LGCTASHISIIEGGKSSGRKKILPSDDMLRRIAQCLGGSPLDVQRRTYQLLLARAREVCSPEVAELLDDQILSGMPAAFLERVRQDVSQYSDEELSRVTEQLQLGGTTEAGAVRHWSVEPSRSGALGPGLRPIVGDLPGGCRVSI
jgi:transcriptional regulator with XRE-family HTH domain